MKIDFQMMTGSKYEISEFIKDVLKVRFPKSPLKQEINDEDPDKINFACPYCGDSEKDQNKKRGNLYLTTKTYKCFNDGCMKWVPLKTFISNFASKYALSIPDLELQRNVDASKTKERELNIIEFLVDRRIGDSLLSIKQVASRFSLTPCAEAEIDSPIYEYITNRKLNHLPAFEKSCYFDSREDKIYLFNLDNSSGKILGFAIRRISNDWKGPRYDIRNYSELQKSGLVRSISDEFLEKINSVNNFFNILNVDFSKPIMITEGQIDSMFLNNSIATTGVTKSKKILGTIVSKKNARILFDRDSAGKGEMIDLIKQGYKVFLWNKLTYDLRLKHMGKSKEIDLIKDINDLYRFLSEYDSSMDYQKFNVVIEQYFSETAFDLIFI